jgi:FAD/FMN-containing dehydrogenase
MGLLSSIAGVLTVAFTTPLIAAATPPPAALAACEAIEARGIETQIVTQDFLHPDYIEAKTHYWSAANGDLTPACATFPINAGEVSTIVSILQRSTGVDFAVKSGGHNPNVGFSSVDGGVLISMSKLASTVLSLDKKTAVIGPGARWREVISALEPDGVTVVSGRLGDYADCTVFGIFD